MDQKKQQDVRRHAAENFLKSFEQQLLEVFQEDSSSEIGKSQPKPQDSSLQPTPTDPSESISLSELEDAIADIDHYFENQQSKNPKSQE